MEARAAASLAQMAAVRFGALSPAEQKLIALAPRREFGWLGPSGDDQSPFNDVAHADKWGPERTIRAALLAWLTTDPDASRLVHPSGIGFGGARITGELDLSYLTSDKPISIIHSYIGDGIDFSYSHLKSFELRSSRARAIDGDLATIDGDVLLSFCSFGEVTFFRARIGGSLDCAGSRFRGAGEDTVSVIDARIGGDALFHNGFSTDGTVDVRLTKIGGGLDFHGAQFTGNDDNGLNAERAEVGGTLSWNEVTLTPKTILDLENATAGALWDDEASWPALGNLTLNGFVYKTIEGGPENSAARLRWIALQGPGYFPQPYRQAAEVLRGDGHDQAAIDVMIAKEIALRRDTKMGHIDRMWNMVLEYTIGYGYRPLRALWWIGGFVIFGAILFGIGYRIGLITPTEEPAYDQFVKTGEAPPHYPVFNAFVYSLENFLPVVVLYQDQYWRPNARHSVGGTIHGSRAMLATGEIPSRVLRIYLWIHILAGWMITPLLFAGLSGLVRPD
jgi:hypothetical protein